jgi:octaprenyl-diphosphate synthase
LDEATLRRHLDTVNARWDNEASILLGDYLFARAMCLATSLEDVFASRIVSQSARSMCEGELRQIESRGNYELSESDYLRIVAGKTAALTACCCRLGAHYAGAGAEVCAALERYGHDLGNPAAEHGHDRRTRGADIVAVALGQPSARCLAPVVPAVRRGFLRA